MFLSKEYSEKRCIKNIREKERGLFVGTETLCSAYCSTYGLAVYSEFNGQASVVFYSL